MTLETPNETFTEKVMIKLYDFKAEKGKFLEALDYIHETE